MKDREENNYKRGDTNTQINDQSALNSEFSFTYFKEVVVLS
jgi:hypothetical protein